MVLASREPHNKEQNCMGNKQETRKQRQETKAADQTVMSCQCCSRYTHPFMAEYLALSCQCHSRYTHPFMAEYLTLSCRTSGEGCKKSSNACHGTDQNAPEWTGRRKRSHICDKMTARCIT